MRPIRLTKSDLTRTEIILPNGSHLRCKYFYEKTSFWKTYSFVHESYQKRQCPLYSGFSSGTDLFVAALDFDTLPPGYESYEAVIDALLALPGITACHSPSGKAKGFLMFRSASKSPNLTWVVNQLNAVLPANLRNRFDPKGIRNFFVTDSIHSTLVDWLECSALVYDWTLDSGTDSNIVSNRNKLVHSGRFSYRQFEGDLPARYQGFIHGARRGAAEREKFVRIVTGCFGLANDQGWSLAQADLAAFIGTTQHTVGRWIQMFIANGWLWKASNSYIVGLKAIKYNAIGDLRSDILSRKKTMNHAKTLIARPPTNGEFYHYLLRLSKAIPSWDSYKMIVESLPGIERKGRYKMATAIFCLDRRKESKGLNKF